MLRLAEPDLTEDEVIAARKEIAASVLSDLAREWLELEPPSLTGLLRQVLALAEREE